MRCTDRRSRRAPIGSIRCGPGAGRERAGSDGSDPVADTAAGSSIPGRRTVLWHPEGRAALPGQTRTDDESGIPMVNPGGESTMLGHWRIVLRQAEEAARVGRFEEAFALATRPDVADHHHAVQFRSRLALDLIARATRRGAVDDLGGAIEDLDLAERMGAPPDSLAAARLSLADRVAEEVRTDLDAGDPARALERIEDLARHKVSGPALRRTREIAEAWQAALAEGRRGEFGRAQEQLDRAERLAAGAGAIGAQQAVAAAKAELESRQKAAAPKVEALYTALSEGKWPAILTAAEAVLAAVPEHPAARQARTRAWQQIAAIGPAAAAQWPRRGPARRPGRRGQPRREPADRPRADRDRATRATPRPGPADGRRHLLARRRGRRRRPPAAAPRPAAATRPARPAASPRPPRRAAAPARWPAPRPTAPGAGSSCGSTASAATSSAWTTGSSWAGPAPTATPMSR